MSHSAFMAVLQRDLLYTAVTRAREQLVIVGHAAALARTRAAQLAVLLTSLVAWEAVRDQISTPVSFAGHSLGQVTALIASGASIGEINAVRKHLSRIKGGRLAAAYAPATVLALVAWALWGKGRRLGQPPAKSTQAETSARRGKATVGLASTAFGVAKLGMVSSRNLETIVGVGSGSLVVASV